MAGFQFAWQKGRALPTPECQEVLIGKSTQIHAGDVLVLTSSATYTTAGGPAVVRPLFSGDTITTSNGIFGVALFDIQTDSSANLTTVSSPVTVDNRGKIETSMLIANILPRDPVSGYLKIWVAVFSPRNVFKGKSYSTDVLNYYAQNRSAAINASAASAPANYTVDITSTAANSPLYVEGVDQEDANFNSAAGGGVLFVSGLATFWQGQTATLYTT